jgi:hypothetical protein
MNVRTVLYVLVLLLVAAFVAANWPLLTTPTEINLLVTTLFVPGAVVGLLLVGVVLLIDWSVHALTRRSWERERRALASEVESLRAQVRQAEGTRLASLHELVERESARIRAQIEELKRDGFAARPASATPAQRLS